MTQSNEPTREVACFYNENGKPHYRSSLSPKSVKFCPDFIRKFVAFDLPVGFCNAIILTRNGANESAIKMAKGAMREQGKLLIMLDDSEVKKMIELKQAGSDPTDYLFEKTDQFLLELSR